MAFRLASIDGRAALVDDGSYHDLETLSGGDLGPDPMQAIAHGSALHDLGDRLGQSSPTGSVDDVVLGPPVPRPRNSFGIGLNYRLHAEEAGLDVPDVPLVFTKFPSCIVGPNADVELGDGSVDYEAELVAVIGAPGRDIDAADAWDHVVGVTAGQDISDRTLQFATRPPHFDLGKSRDTYGPIGPYLVSTDLLEDRDAVPITCEVNGEVRQRSTTEQMIFDVPALVAYLSSVLTLAPGDLIFTGTPEGVGTTTGTFLAPGDVVTTTIGGVGTMENRCR